MRSLYFKKFLNQIKLTWFFPFFIINGLILAACAGQGNQSVTSTKRLFEVLLPQINLPIKDGQTDVVLTDNFEVSSTDGLVSKVKLVNDGGEELTGSFTKNGTWRSDTHLSYDRSYVAEVEVKGLTGVLKRKFKFTMKRPKNQTQPYTILQNGGVFGIGQPVAIQFDENIPNKKAAQDAITIKTNPPVKGAFFWISQREVRWRPEHFWKPGTTVEVSVNVYGKDLGQGLYGQDDLHTKFQIGEALIAVADDITKMITVNLNGEIIKKIPTSMGRDKYPTNQGIYIIGDRLDNIVMDSSTFGVPTNSPDGYKINVKYATQMSYSGIYIHSAPWSVAQQGYVNTSHGCLNVNTENAKWFVRNAKRGDIVIVKNTIGPVLSGYDGLGDWNIPWKVWKQGNYNDWD